jgi:hypothetical protein
MTAQIGNAILQFKNKHVNRVIFFTDLGELQTLWFPQAQSESFNPVYGLSSIDWPSHFAGFAPNQQMHGAIGVGWLPAFDVLTDQDPGGNPAATLCKKILQAAGQTPDAGRSNRCDTIFFIKTVLDRTASFTADGIRQTVEQLGTSFAPAASFSTQFGPGRYDGPASYRYMYFDDGCTCMRYRGTLHPMS